MLTNVTKIITPNTFVLILSLLGILGLALRLRSLISLADRNCPHPSAAPAPKG